MSAGGVLFHMPDLLAVRPVESVDSVLRSLVELGADRRQIEMVPVGIFRRYRGILLGFFPEAGSEIRAGDELRLYLAERALADRLPEGFLKPLPEEGRPESVFDTVQGGFARGGEEALPDGAPGHAWDPEELARRQLDGGRQLLRLLDRALRRARRDIVLRHQALHFLAGDAEFARRLLALLHLEALAADDPAAVFAAGTVGGVLEAVGTLEEAAALLGQLFGVAVTAAEEPAGTVAVPRPLRARLGGGNALLGRTCTPGRRFRDPRPAVVFRVGPMGAQEAGRRYLDAARRAALEAAVRALVPASRPARVVFEVRPEERAARPGRPANGLLGRTMYLGGAR
ncbi:MAG TPA: type VI secretion system baseplate subunit TssG [Candidatus Saccharimonadales bacterium]|nr:type VI secretion system baseplate subunit TssG [Candidatus Saccharimonadales bacterium]